MLRLISVIGIAIAMVIGFIAISSKMKDDYTVRSRVVSVLKQMMDLAYDELECGEKKNPENNQKKLTGESSEAPAVEMSADLETIPLVESQTADKQATETNDGGNSTVSSDTKDEQRQIPETSTDSSDENNSVRSETLEGSDFKENTDIIQRMGYRILNPGHVEVIVLFNDINGESGKTHVKSGSRIVINCYCQTEELACETVESNINKNYFPKTLTRR